MTNEGKLIIQNQMITNSLLKLMVAKSMTNSTPMLIAKRRKLRYGESIENLVESGVRIACDACSTIPGIGFSSHEDPEKRQ